MDLSEILSVEELAGIDPAKLSDMVTTHSADNHLAFDNMEYTPFEEFIHSVNNLPEKPKRVHNYALSRNGKVRQDSMKLYLSNEGNSSGELKEILKTPRHYLIAKRQELPEPNEDHFDLGTFIHSAFLEPKKFRFIRVEPKHSRAQIKGCQALIYYYWEILSEYGEDISHWNLTQLKEILSELETKAKLQGYTFVSEDELKIINCIRATYKMYGGGMLKKFLKNVKAECSMYGVDPSTGLKVKIRPDAIMLEENFGFNGIVSMKTTSATTLEGFVSDCAKFKYEVAEGMYLDVASHVTGRQFTATVMIMAQTVAPFGIAAWYWNAEDLQVGKYKYRQALSLLQQCRDNNEWLGFDSRAEEGHCGFIEMKLPEYIKKELPPQYVKS